MARDKDGIPFHPKEYNPDFPRIKCPICGLMNSCDHGLANAVPWYPRLPILLEGGMVESIDDFVLDRYTEWGLQKIVESKVINNKLVIEDFIHPDLLSLLIRSWPPVMYEIDVKGRLQADFSCNSYFKELYDKVFNNEYVRCAIADKFSLEAEFNVDMWLWEDNQDFTVNDVHVDFDGFDITFGLYLPGEYENYLKDYGTQFWAPKEDNIDDLNKSLIREECSLIDQLPFKNGVSYFMPRSKYSWHSSPILDKPMRRRHVYGYFKSA